MLNVYRASAGSGKTYRLTYEYIKMLLGRRDYGCPADGDVAASSYKFYDNYNNAHRRILAVTFTNKATSEMKQRIVDELETLAHNTEKSSYCKNLCNDFSCGVAQLQKNVTLVLQQLLHDFSYFNISTIDSFFQQVLRAFTREVGLQGGYEVEMDTDYVTMAAIDRMFDDLDNKPELLDWLLQYAEESIRNDGSWNIHDKSDIPELAKQLTSEVYKRHRDKLPQNNLQAYKDYITTLTQYQVDMRNQIAQAAEVALHAVEANGISEEFFTRGWIKSLDVLADAGCTDLGSKEPMGKAVASFEKYYVDPDKWFAKTKLKKTPWTVEELIDLTAPILEPVAKVLDDTLISLRSVAPALKHIYSLGVLSTIDDNIMEYEQEHNTILLDKAPEILSGLINKSDAPFIYEKIGTRVAHYMIDEFQDTSDLQWRNFEPLVNESLAWRNENLIVGDVKQSIYRFRNSDWRLLHEGLDKYDYKLVNKGNDTNWRSCANVVAFNNTFFKNAAQLLQGQLMQLKPAGVELCTDTLINDIYAQVAQNIAPKHTTHGGHVEMHVVDAPNKDTFVNRVNERIPEMLRNLLEKGFRQKDIAFLVRAGKDGRALVELLLSISSEYDGVLRNLRVVSDESLLITNAPPVKLILGILRYLQNPNYPINELVLAYEYDMITDGDAGRALMSYFDNRDSGTSINEELQTFIAEISAKPLFEMCEQIIHKFGLHKQPMYVAYLEAFQDVVINYCRNHSADLYSFLRWWDDTGSSATVKSPENIDAIKVCTIHKSKGLEYPVVIIPYGTWQLSTAGRGKALSIKWYEPDREPFNLLPVLPIDHKNELASTIFAQQYFEEVINEYVDCLNVLYVAFTRAAQELIVYTYPGNSNTTGSVIAGAINMPVVADDTDCDMIDLAAHIEEREGETVLEIGADWQPVYDDKPTAQMVDVAYNVVVPTDSRLKQRTQSRSTSNDRKRNYGILMHDILADIYTADDIVAVVQRCVREGRLKSKKAQMTEEKIRAFIAHPMAQRWFSPQVRIVTETDILKSGTKVHRPDRIVIDGDRVTVVDYKFGWIESDDYNTKVSEYMQLVRDMGYKQVDGCIWYVEKGKFVPVE